MTKKEREAIQKEFNRINEFKEWADHYFDGLKAANGEVTGTKWCSAYDNYRDLIKADSKNAERYRMMYEQYLEYKAKEDAYIQFGGVLAEAGFWKNH